MSLLKKIYISSSGVYITSVFGLSISRMSLKITNRFIGETTIESYNTFAGGEFGYNRGFNHEISVSVNYNTSYASLTKDNSDITKTSGGYKTLLDKVISFDVFYKYHFLNLNLVGFIVCLKQNTIYIIKIINIKKLLLSTLRLK